MDSLTLSQFVFDGLRETRNALFEGLWKAEFRDMHLIEKILATAGLTARCIHMAAYKPLVTRGISLYSSLFACGDPSAALRPAVSILKVAAHRSVLGVFLDERSIVRRVCAPAAECWCSTSIEAAAYLSWHTSFKPGPLNNIYGPHKCAGCDNNRMHVNSATRDRWRETLADICCRAPAGDVSPEAARIAGYLCGQAAVPQTENKKTAMCMSAGDRPAA